VNVEYYAYWPRVHFRCKGQWFIHTDTNINVAVAVAVAGM
jgi:hypothetical protein